IMLGSGYQKMSFGSGIFQKENSINAMMEINSSVGYNGDNFFMSIGTGYVKHFSPISEYMICNDYYYFQLLIGLRF
ncbi:MAG: hypothetical protein U9R42_02155, partial [Bacteroidota bacterium]|nr:hypothetical protein [Bacteroidota bacterium]